jgi:hypothetical protein
MERVIESIDVNLIQSSFSSSGVFQCHHAACSSVCLIFHFHPSFQAWRLRCVRRVVRERCKTKTMISSAPLRLTPCLQVMRSFSSQRLLRLDQLKPIPEAWKIRKRVGRGSGSGLGKMSGYGHQCSRVTPRGFEGGQTPLYKVFPKIGFHNVT